MLSWLTRIRARAYAAKAWIESANNPALAEELYREMFEDASKEATDKLLAFAYPLWQHWIDNRISEPGEFASKREPGFED